MTPDFVRRSTEEYWRPLAKRLECSERVHVRGFVATVEVFDPGHVRNCKPEAACYCGLPGYNPMTTVRKYEERGNSDMVGYGRVFKQIFVFERAPWLRFTPVKEWL